MLLTKIFLPALLFTVIESHGGDRVLIIVDHSQENREKLATPRWQMMKRKRRACPQTASRMLRSFRERSSDGLCGSG